MRAATGVAMSATPSATAKASGLATRVPRIAIHCAQHRGAAHEQAGGDALVDFDLFDRKKTGGAIQRDCSLVVGAANDLHVVDFEPVALTQQRTDQRATNSPARKPLFDCDCENLGFRQL